MEERYLTVSALTKYIKYKFDNDFHLTDVYLKVRYQTLSIIQGAIFILP